MLMDQFQVGTGKILISRCPGSLSVIALSRIQAVRRITEDGALEGMLDPGGDWHLSTRHNCGDNNRRRMLLSKLL